MKRISPSGRRFLVTAAVIAAAAVVSPVAGAVILFNQFAVTTQITANRAHLSGLSANDGQSADDFTVPAGPNWNVTTVRIRVSLAPSGTVSVIFYSNISNLPGTAECTRTGLAFSSTMDGTSPYLQIPLGSACVLAAGVHWLEVRGSGTSPVLNVIGDGTSAVGNGMVFQNAQFAPGGAGSCPFGAWFPATTCTNVNGKVSNPPFAFNMKFQLLSSAGTTATLLRGFRARVTSRGVELRWLTAQEAGLLGFNLYRERHGRLVRLNRAPITSVFAGTTTGRSYSWLDSGARPQAARYRLQAIGIDGTRRWLGTASATR